LIVARTVRFDGFTATIYVRPSAKVSGLSGGWITPDGLTIEVTKETLRRFPVIRLAGNASYSPLPKVPTVTAAIDTGEVTETVPASLSLSAKSYEILLDLSKIDLPQSDPVCLRVNFDTFFIPKWMGISKDTRELVLPAPNLIRMSPPSP
jgi:hypothetical protein